MKRQGAKQEAPCSSRDVPGVAVNVYVSSREGDRLTRKADLYFGDDDSSLPTLEVEEGTRYQKIAGFGASFNETGMICLNSLDAEAQDRVFESLFDPVSADSCLQYTARKHR